MKRQSTKQSRIVRSQQLQSTVRLASLTSLATTPSCSQGIMQWQHGTYSLPGNGSILLQPFAVDGRQLMSSPCSYDQSVYTRYEQLELYKVRPNPSIPPYRSLTLIS